jgi:hypothetical protein
MLAPDHPVHPSVIDLKPLDPGSLMTVHCSRRGRGA